MVSPRKVQAEKDRLVRECGRCGGRGCPICVRYGSFVDQMAEAQIPVDYWFREMEGFYGEEAFGNAVKAYIAGIGAEYARGQVLCMSGPRGTGKTMAACAILKAAILQEYEARYCTLVEAIDMLLSSEAHAFRRGLRQWDFMVLDEVDQRHFSSPGSRDLYSRHFEDILRTRTQNRLPLVICTNSQDPGEIFQGQFKESFDSLRSQFFRELPACGSDARKGREKHGA